MIPPGSPWISEQPNTMVIGGLGDHAGRSPPHWPAQCCGMALRDNYRYVASSEPSAIRFVPPAQQEGHDGKCATFWLSCDQPCGWRIHRLTSLTLDMSV